MELHWIWQMANAWLADFWMFTHGLGRVSIAIG